MAVSAVGRRRRRPIIQSSGARSSVTVAGSRWLDQSLCWCSDSFSSSSRFHHVSLENVNQPILPDAQPIARNMSRFINESLFINENFLNNSKLPLWTVLLYVWFYERIDLVQAHIIYQEITFTDRRTISFDLSIVERVIRFEHPSLHHCFDKGSLFAKDRKHMLPTRISRPFEPEWTAQF